MRNLSNASSNISGEVNRGRGVRNPWKFWSVVQGSKGWQPRVEIPELLFPPLVTFAFRIEGKSTDRLQEV